MIREFKGRRAAKDVKIGIVVSRFNEWITKSLLAGALECLELSGVDQEAITVVWVPGAYEIPLTAQKLASLFSLDAVVCLGAVIRGETPHFDLVAGEAASGISRVSLETGIPMIFGVLTTDSLEQALERSGGKAGNKGFEAAEAALEMVDLFRTLRIEIS